MPFTWCEVTFFLHFFCNVVGQHTGVLVADTGRIERPASRKLRREETTTGSTTQPPMESTCETSREFEYRDSDCGPKPLRYNMSDLLQAFNMEQAYWTEQGDLNPWWAVDTSLRKGEDLPFLQKLEFYKTGTYKIREVAESFEQIDLNMSLGADLPAESVALDLGCGLGRLSHALARHGFKKVFCVDNSQSMLKKATKTLDMLAGQGDIMPDVLDYVQLVHSTPNLACSIAMESVNFVHSQLTLQHMKPLLQVAYIEQLCDLLQKGGLGYFQIPTSCPKSRKYDIHCLLNNEDHAMNMHYTRKEEVHRHLNSRGCEVLFAIRGLHDIGTAGTSMHFGFRKSL